LKGRMKIEERREGYAKLLDESIEVIIIKKLKV
jgi:hypothetical protein